MRKLSKVLVANRGEIAVRIMRACRDAGLCSVAIYADSDRDAPFVRLADEALALDGTTAAESYLAVDKVLGAAHKAGADAIHPGYGFLSENADFAQAVIDAGLAWIGPAPQVIRDLGDKVTARHIALRAGVPVVPGTDGPVSGPEEVEAFADEYGFPVAIKAAFGGGGRGMRVGRARREIRELYESAVREATVAFGRGECFVERYLDKPRHVEAQVLADVHGHVVVVGTRDCSLQRRFQKLVEEAPAPFLSDLQRETIHDAATAICKEAGYHGAGTVEFLVGQDGLIYFLEVNARLQVEHPVSEETSGLDLVRAQFRVAEGAVLNLGETPEPRGHSIEFRINAEDVGRGFLPAAGTITSITVPDGPGVRVDAGMEAGSVIGEQFDSLLAKLIVTGSDRMQALERARRALAEFRVEGIATVLPFHRLVVEDPSFAAISAEDFAVHTRWIDTEWENTVPPFGDDTEAGEPVDVGSVSVQAGPAFQMGGGAADVPSGSVTAPMPGTVVELAVSEGDRVRAGDLLVVLEAMKMEHRVTADRQGTVSGLAVGAGQAVARGAVLLSIGDEAAATADQRAEGERRTVVRHLSRVETTPGHLAPPVVRRDEHLMTGTTGAAMNFRSSTGSSRPQQRVETAAVPGQKPANSTAREVLLSRRAARRGEGAVSGRQLPAWGRVERLCDPRSFVELAPLRRGHAPTYGGAGVARDGDGVIAGFGSVAGRPVAVVAHDFGVAGGSIGSGFAESVVRLQQLAMDVGAPIIYLNDSGGARIHEGIQSLHGCGRIFTQNVRAQRVVPQVSVIMGPCAGAAAYSPALTDWTIMVRGRGQMFLTGPEVVRAAVGEVVDPDDLGGALLHTTDSGVAHLDAADELEALAAVRQLLGFLPSRAGAPVPVIGAVAPQVEPDVLATVVPESPARPFNMRRVLAAVLDGGDELELMPGFGPSLLTGFARLDGVPVGVVASQPKCGGGVLDAQTAVKCSRFVSFCGRFGLPVLTFLDVPGFMPGSVEERKGVITHGAGMLAAYVEAAVPKLTLVVRKAYGGAYIAMGSRSLGADFTWAWTSAELAVMGPEAAVGLLHRRELAAAGDPADTRRELAAEYRTTVTHPFLAAEAGIIDEVILPEESRGRMVSALRLLMSKESC
jgi:acetyl-CoA/propionyl-CoA carboxylase, biotin carboxylase, biotin carboxyl carrier protein